MAAQLWDQLCPMLHRAGILTEADGMALALLCRAWQRYLTAEAVVAKEGVTTKTADGSIKMHPAVTVSNLSWGQIVKGCAMFGLDPLDRPAIRGLPQQSEPTIEELLESTRDIWDTKKHKSKGKRNAG